MVMDGPENRTNENLGLKLIFLHSFFIYFVAYVYRVYNFYYRSYVLHKVLSDIG